MKPKRTSNSREAQIRVLEQELFLWRRKLKKHPKEAKEEVEQKMRFLKSLNKFNKADLDRFFSHMLNGVTTPSDFTKDRI